MEDVIKVLKPSEGSGNELLPCPFCGSDNVMFMQYKHPNGQLRWRVVCGGCAASIDPGYAQMPHTVAEKWNRRQQWEKS